MQKNRVEAFSDGVIAIIITIMVLEMKVPHGAEWSQLKELQNVFLSYVLSFAHIGIYWNNHHHMLHTVERVTGRIMWANLHLLFWLSLVPFVTGWMGENDFAPLPTAVYGSVLFLCGVAYKVLQSAIVQGHGPESKLAAAVGSDAKGRLSLVGYGVAVPLSLFVPWAGLAIYALVAAMWFVPDRRITMQAT